MTKTKRQKNFLGRDTTVNFPDSTSCEECNEPGHRPNCSRALRFRAELPVVTSVSLGRTINVGGYESVRVDMSANVPPGGSHADTLEYLRGEVSKVEVTLRCAYAKGY